MLRDPGRFEAQRGVRLKILFITTGGTIAGNVRGADGAHVTGDVMSEAAGKAVDAMLKNWKLNVEITTIEIDDIDSSDVTPELWTLVAQCVHDNYDEYDGFVVTHGTNTMGYSAAALSFAIGNSGKPIVLTGSQIPHASPGSDALINVENAVRIASYPRQYAAISGVVVVFGSHLITGVRAKKSTEFDLDAFQTFSAGSLGRIGRILDLNEANLARHQSYLSKERPVAIAASDLVFHPDFEMAGIASYTEFPGLTSESLIAAAKAWKAGGKPLQGVIFRSFGAGDVGKFRWPYLEYLKKNEIPIVITTQAPNGKATLTVNKPGEYIEKNELGIPAHDMSIESMTVKLGWLIAQGKTYAQIKDLMGKDLRGEINITRELSWT
jgi:L-asparaginase